MEPMKRLLAGCWSALFFAGLAWICCAPVAAETLRYGLQIPDGDSVTYLLDLDVRYPGELTVKADWNGPRNLSFKLTPPDRAYGALLRSGPSPQEMETCLPYLREQIGILRPKVIVSLGATALKGLVDVQGGITRLRGTWLSFDGIDLMPTYHPAYLLRSPQYKKDAWEDLKAVLTRLGRTPPPVSKKR